jgi:hypothetical protein
MAEKLDSVGTEINPAAFENETLAFLHRYWSDKRGSRAMPSRADLKVSELKEHLGWVAIVEVLPDLADFRYRLIGTLITQYFLEDGTGKTVGEIYGTRNDGAAKGIRAIFRKCARDAVVVRAFGEANWLARGFEKFDCICLPLSDDGVTVNMLLHAFVFDKPSVMLAREMARGNGGHLPDVPAGLT